MNSKNYKEYCRELARRGPKLDDEDEEEEGTNKVLGVITRSKSQFLHTFFLDEDIKSPNYYRGLLNTLYTADEETIIEIFINSDGGSLASTISIIQGIRNSQAKVVGIHAGAAYSGAGAILLACDEVVVLAGSTFLAHDSRYGVGGKGFDNKTHVDFLQSHVHRFVDDIYKGFLSPEEMQAIKHGKELYFHSDEVEARLIKRMESQKAEIDAEVERVEALEQKATKLKKAATKGNTPLTKKAKSK